MRPLNLASHPFRNERAPALLAAILAALVLAATVWHVRVLVRVAGSRHAARASEVRQLEQESARLRAETAAVRSVRPDPATVAQWSAIRDLVERRLFSWTRLLSQLESILPREVRLLSIAPRVEKGRIQLDVNAEASPPDEGFRLIDVLQKQGPFADVYPRTVTTKDNSALYAYTMRYLEKTSPPPTVPHPAGGAAAASGAEAAR
jgi:Tfp pilus assembly protein PilN